MADVHLVLSDDDSIPDPFGTNHPGALVILVVAGAATIGSMAWLYRRNEEAHEHLQKQLESLASRLT
jgi:hypothetical protein